MEINIVVDDKAVKKQAEVKVDKLGRFYATGKRKTAIARVWLKKGKGKTTVNKQELNKYFPGYTAVMLVGFPFSITDTVGKYDVMCTVKGGGVAAQADAIKHGISKALALCNPEAYRSLLRQAGLLTRDARVVERKKYGRKKARKSFQFSKR